jgi:hypothetical protein
MYALQISERKNTKSKGGKRVFAPDNKIIRIREEVVVLFTHWLSGELQNIEPL